MIYDVTITRTGGIVVEADNENEAIEAVNSLSLSEIEEHAQLTGWEASDPNLQDNEERNDV